MSGGIAYVLDYYGDFSLRANPEMVELEPLEDPRTPEERARVEFDYEGLEEVARDMLAQDAARVQVMLLNHERLTGSTRAREILDNWDKFVPRFVKVMPTDYRRALTEMREQAEAEADPSPRRARGRARQQGSYQHG
jgi:glutamate synthase (NADPH/NADH) large chain